MNPTDDVEAPDRSGNGTASDTATPDIFFGNIDILVVNSVRRLMRDASININDDFFHIGGNSILAVRLAHIIREEFGIRRTARLIFQHPVLSDFCETLSQLLRDTRENHG
jgi:hypothetical protein